MGKITGGALYAWDSEEACDRNPEYSPPTKLLEE